MVLASLRTVAVVLSVAAGLSACSDEEPGTALPAPSSIGSSTSTDQSSTSSQAPVVAEPLDVGRYLKSPCGLIDGSLLAGLGAPASGMPDTNDTSVGCIWIDSASGSAISMSILTANKNGLADMYKLNESGRFEEGYFETETVDGYPAVFADGTDGRAEGRCSLVFGVSDTVSIRSGLQGGEGAGSCDKARDAAAAVIKTLQGAS